MHKKVFGRLALTNIKKNKGTYIPYMIMCIVCIAMLYMMFFILKNPGIEAIPKAGDVQSILSVGIIVVVLFSCIFLLYSNSFVMKRRQKEFGLYNILGMEKGHIGRMLSIETVLTSVVCLILGILVGILGSKLALLLLLKLIRIPAQFGFQVSFFGMAMCAVIFGVIFLLALLNNLRRVHLSRPVELLWGSSVGEREPKAKWLLALLGFICLGSGYYIAVTTESPLDAITLFFVAVLLVMAGTYLLFVAGSIAIFKMMRWKKSFYYKTKNFTSVSGMIYRMKQNAVGLASICILSTAVLLMLSTTVSLNFGMQDILNYRYPYDISVGIRNADREQAKAAREDILAFIEEESIPCEEITSEMSLNQVCILDGNQIRFQDDVNVFGSIVFLQVLSSEEYQRLSQEETDLKEGEVLVYSNGDIQVDSFVLEDLPLSVKGRVADWPVNNQDNLYGLDTLCLVVSGEDYDRIDSAQREIYGESSGVPMLEINVNIDGSAEDEIFYGGLLRSHAQEYIEDQKLSDTIWLSTEIREENHDQFYTLDGGLLFLGIFLGGLFLVGTAMIIYYKQISEGYEDKERYEIMRKVGMSKKEVKSSIRRQILMVFFLPLLMACLHIAMAFPLMKRLLMLMQLDNTRLFILCTAATAAVFALVYLLIYSFTAKSYYRILDRAK